MSLATFKKKSITASLGTNRSGKPPGGYWLPQGPFGGKSSILKLAESYYGPVGFSINGGSRNVGGVGKDYKMSKNGTPFRGIYPYGDGGNGQGRARRRGTTLESNYPVFNVNRVIVLGDQAQYIKPSVLSTYGMLRKKYRWAYNGKYPNYWVQPVYTSGSQSDTKSQGMYLHNLKATYTRYINVNDKNKYENYYKKGGPALCTVNSAATAQFTYNQLAANAPYTKELNQPIAASEYTTYVQRKCVNPNVLQKPFPYAVQTGTSQSVAGSSVRKFASGCGTGPVFTEPPNWYTALKNGQQATKSYYKENKESC